MSDEEQMNRFREWWQENGMSLLVAVGVAVAAIIGWNTYSAQRQQTAEAGTAAYAEYVDAGTGEEKSAIAQRIRTDFDSTSYHALVALAEAKEAVEAGDLPAAEGKLLEAKTAAPDSLLKDLASLRLAKVQQALGNSEVALKTLQSIRNAGYRAWALELTGDIYFAEGDVEQAYQAYSSAIETLGAEAEDRTLLQIKRDNTAPSNGQFTARAQPLEQALREARETLESEGSADGDSAQ